MNSKSVLVLTGLLVWGASFAPAQDVSSNQWTLYEASSLGDRLAYLQAQKPEAVSDAFLVQALTLADSEGIEKGSDNEKAAKRSLAQFLCTTLGNRKLVSSGALLGRIAVQYRDPYLRGEAWLALGRLGDSRQVADMVRELDLINTGALRSRPQEITAAYILTALGLLKAPSAFREVALASLGWFSPASGVRELARKTLPLLVTDPVAAKLELLRNDDDLLFREALFNDLGVDQDRELGGRAAEAALSTLVTFQLRDSKEKDAAQRLIKASLSAALAAPTPPAAIAAPLKALLAQPRAEVLSRQFAVQILAKVGDANSTDILVAQLQKDNLAQKQGALAPDEVPIVREIILGLGKIKKSAARPVLQDVRFSDYTPAIVALAVDALAALEP